MSTKKIRLTEDQLVSLIKKAIKEQTTQSSEPKKLPDGNGKWESPYKASQIQKDVDTAVDDLDGYVNTGNLSSLLSIVRKYRGKVAWDESDPDNPQRVSACSIFGALYEADEDTTFDADVESIGTSILGGNANMLKKQIISVFSACSLEEPKDPSTSTQNTQQQQQQQPTTVKMQCAIDIPGAKLDGDIIRIPHKNGEMRIYSDGRDFTSKPGNNISFISTDRKIIKYAKAQCQQMSETEDAGLKITTQWVA